MELHEFDSFQELARAQFSHEKIILGALPDIQSVCSQSPKGFKKKLQGKESDHALEKAVTHLRMKYSSPEAFRTAIANCTFDPSFNIDKSQLFHFASIWMNHEQRLQNITTDRDQFSADVNHVLRYRAKSTTPVTSVELEQIRFKKQQRKEARERSNPETPHE